MNIGIEASASVGSVFNSFPTSDEVKSSGAVSPATRAVARVAPVTIPPIVCGSTTLRVVRHLGAPSARLASRSESGTSASTSWVDRATIGSIRIERANPAFKAVCP